ncbi:MAG TPA: PQQ-dependent sugar dehydrogenase [Vicinamibacterales bacterium]|nr:PQQ-dependent sugar dehydrogenase [Vicinamibacterales bacterium]
MSRSVTPLITATAVAAMVAAAAAVQQQLSNDPFPPIETTKDVIAVNFVEFATIPDANGQAPRMMHFEDEPATRRFFVSTMRGPIYSVSYDGKTVTEYIDVNATAWGIGVQSQGSERGLQSFTFHPQFTRKGTPGFGKFYVYTDTTDITPTPDFPSPGPNRTHDTVLLEWTAKDPAAVTYDGGAPRVLFRTGHPFSNHNGGQIAFNPLAAQNSPEFGLLYVGFADGGSGGDPFNLSQNLASPFGKILRIDPFGKNSANGQYGIPPSNPFVKNAKPDTLGEIYAYGVRNPQRFSWDVKTTRMYVADIGQNTIEEISPVTAGANLGWNKWEGSYLYGRGGVDMSNPRGEPGLTWPVAEFDHRDPLFNRAAITGVYVYRGTAIKQLAHLLIFGDNPSGEIFYVEADNLPKDAQAAAAIRRILLNDKGTPKTLLQLIKEKNAEQGKTPATRADLRLGLGPQGQIFVMNKRDGVIRLLVPEPAPAR